MEAGGRRIERGRERATGVRKEVAGAGQTASGGGAEGRTSWGTAAQGAKKQAGTIDPGMEYVKAGFVAGEGKAVSSTRSQVGEKGKAAARQEALIPRVEKPPVGELKGKASGALICTA